MDFSGITNLVGILKIVTIVVGIIDLGFTAHVYSDYYSEEEYFLSIIIIALLTSVVLLVLTLIKMIPNAHQWKQIDMGVHAAMAVLIVIGAILMAVQANKVREWRKHKGWKHQYNERIISSALGFLNCAIYGFISFAVFRSQPSS